MPKALFVLLITVLIQSANCTAYSQVSEVECSVYRRSGVYLTLTPVYWDEPALPKTGTTVHLFILVTSNLPNGKSTGYYQLFTMEVVKTAPEIKSIIFKAHESFEDAKAKVGLSDLELNRESKVKIAW